MDPTRGRLPTPEAHDPTSTRGTRPQHLNTDSHGHQRCSRQQSPTHDTAVTWDRSAGPAPPHGRHERLRNGGAWSDPWSGRVKIGTRPRQRSSRARHGRALRGPVAAPVGPHSLRRRARRAPLQRSTHHALQDRTIAEPYRRDCTCIFASIKIDWFIKIVIRSYRAARPGERTRTPKTRPLTGATDWTDIAAARDDD